MAESYSDSQVGEAFFYSQCVDEGTSLEFTIEDAFGNGVCCQYGFELQYQVWCRQS